MGQGLSAIRARRAPFADRFLHDRVLTECAAPDILCLQELLSRDAQRFFDGVGTERFTSRFRDHNRPRFAGRLTMRGSGLGIGARTPLGNTTVRTLAGVPSGWDRLARKGALHTRLAVPGGITIDLMTVHLQAGYDARAIGSRTAQLADLRRFIDEVGSRDRPFIVCGDFNIDGLEHARSGTQYRSLAAAFEGFEDLGAAADLPTFDPHPERNALAHALEPDADSQRIDYIFWRPARDRSRLRCQRVDLFFDQSLARPARTSAASVWASDHYGLSATFVLEGHTATTNGP
jgi:endonuclease/exonuclease/phosphatase family metal-dependent hydrolase